jgi:bifunctional NMN adenylyltransferase/nudix hydrolase
MTFHPETHATVIGRMMPPHAGHIGLIREGLSKAGFMLVILGSCGGPRTPVNPFSFEERKAMIALSLTPQEMSRVSVVGVIDHYDMAPWVRDVEQAIQSDMSARGCQGPSLLVGHFKDASSSYLSTLAELESCVLHECPSFHGGLNATDIRLALFESDESGMESLIRSSAMLEEQFRWLRFWLASDVGRWVQNYHFGVKEYQDHWGTGPFHTADVVLRCNGHVLVIERGGDPTKPHIGAGLWASPGGFRDPGESAFEAAIRELDEETQIITLGDVTREELVQGLVRAQEFNHRLRSPRAHIITTNHLIHLPHKKQLPAIKAKSDAKEARWEPEGFIEKFGERMFEDHLHMFKSMLRPVVS